MRSCFNCGWESNGGIGLNRFSDRAEMCNSCESLILAEAKLFRLMRASDDAMAEAERQRREVAQAQAALTERRRVWKV